MRPNFKMLFLFALVGLAGCGFDNNSIPGVTNQNSFYATCTLSNISEVIVCEDFSANLPAYQTSCAGSEMAT